jgi:hypothetical protein
MNIFETFAECSIALAGFGAIHAVLHGSTGPRGAFRALFVVTQGGFAFILSLLPLLLDLASMSDDQLWRVASLFGVAGAGAVTYSQIVIDTRMTRLGHPPQAPLIVRTAQTLSVLAMSAMFANLIGWPWNPGALPYATAVIFVLIAGLLALLHSFMVPVQIALSGNDSGQSKEPPVA